MYKTNKQTNGITNPLNRVAFKGGDIILTQNAKEDVLKGIFQIELYDNSHANKIISEHAIADIRIDNHATVNEIEEVDPYPPARSRFIAYPDTNKIKIKLCGSSKTQCVKATSNIMIFDNAFVDKAECNSATIGGKASVNKIKGKSNLYVKGNAFIKEASASKIDIYGSASIEKVNNTNELCLSDSAFVKNASTTKAILSSNSKAEKINAESIWLNDSSQADNVITDNAELRGNAKANNIKTKNNATLKEKSLARFITADNEILLMDEASAEKLDAQKITLLNNAKAEEITANEAELSDQVKAGNIKARNIARLKGKSYAKYIVSENNIVLENESFAKNLNAKNVTLSGTAKADEIIVKDRLVLSGNCEVENIRVTGDKPEIIFEGNAKITGKIRFNNGSGIVYIKRNSDKSLPQISESQIINGRIEKLGPKIGFDKVAGMEDLKQQLREDVIEPMEKPELYTKYGLQPINGILMYGPPGCGKTYIANALAEETGRHFVEIKMSNVGSSYQNVTVNNLKAKFDEAIAKAPSIILLDEVETLAPEREYIPKEYPEVAERVTELLTQLNNCADKKIFVICASNEPQKVDKAVRRTGRMDKRIYVGPPDEKSRQEMFKMHLKDRYINNNIDYKLISEKTSNYIASDIKALVDQAARYALRTKEPISTQHVLQAIETTKPSLTKNIIEYYKNKIEE